MRITTCCLLASGLLATACQAGAPGPGGSSIDQGLTVFTQTQKDGLVGMYAEGERAVFFETVTKPITDELIVHYADHDIPLSRPTFMMRWTDEEGRAVMQDGDWETPDEEYADPVAWEGTLDLTRRAGLALAGASLEPEVALEQESLVTTAGRIPEASARIIEVTPEEIEQINERQIAYGYLGYSWKAKYYVIKPTGVNFHQGSEWYNYRYYSGAWRLYDYKLRDNDVYSPERECSGVWSNVQDYKSYGATDTTTNLGYNGFCGGTYAVCTLPLTQSFNCRSEALRQQVWVTGNVRCSAWSGMCDTAQGVPWGAYCGVRTTCASRSTC